MLYLDGEGGPQSGGGIVNNCCFPSEVAPSYAPPGQVRRWQGIVWGKGRGQGLMGAREACMCRRRGC